jgi:hypothetical protein
MLSGAAVSISEKAGSFKITDWNLMTRSTSFLLLAATEGKTLGAKSTFGGVFASAEPTFEGELFAVASTTASAPAFGFGPVLFPTGAFLFFAGISTRRSEIDQLQRKARKFKTADEQTAFEPTDAKR